MVKVGDAVEVKCCNQDDCDASGSATVTSVSPEGVIDIQFEGDTAEWGPYGPGEYEVITR